MEFVCVTTLLHNFKLRFPESENTDVAYLDVVNAILNQPEAARQDIANDLWMLHVARSDANARREVKWID